MRDPELPYSEFTAQFAALHARMPQKLDTQFSQVLDRAKQRQAEFPSRQLLKVFHKFLDENVPAKADADLLTATLAPLTVVLDNYADGQKVRELTVVADLLNNYADGRAPVLRSPASGRGGHPEAP